MGGHAFERGILEHLSAATLVGVVGAFEELLEELDGKGLDVPQPCALQLFYDLKFVTSVLMLPKEGEVSLRVVRGHWRACWASQGLNEVCCLCLLGRRVKEDQGCLGEAARVGGPV